MGGTIFVSWALWEKMTFVLALCIGAVFLAGLFKLWWMSRYVKKHELIDEEKRIKERQMRESGIWIEPKNKGADIPFGVRAIESGIEVDGIWISSKGAQPLSARLKTVRGPQSAESSSSTESEQSSLPRGRPPVPRSTSSQSAFEKAVAAEALSTSESFTAQTPSSSYKPRRSSHLRFSSYTEGQFDQKTLGALEGNPIPPKNPARKLRKKTHQYPNSINSAADNERSDSDSEDISSHFISASEEPITNTGSRLKTQQNAGDYFSVPHDETPQEKVNNPFATPNQSPPSNAMNNEEIIADYELPLLRDPSPAPSAPKANKSVRRVNSGFEVLPAGTFETSIDVKGKGVDRGGSSGSSGSRVSQDTPQKEKRQSKKLQKKPRSSMSSGRSSSFLERI